MNNEATTETAYQNCRLCPRACGVDRTAGQSGICGETAICRVASIGPHHGEEPCFSGTRGSGTLFFSGCSCRCFFCQNYQISMEHTGRAIQPDELLSEALRLVDQGVHNLNFVTPDHFWPHIARLCRELRARGVKIPFLFNCSGYQSADRVEAYGEWIDIFMPDFKFADPQLAQDCMRDKRYPEIALAALTKMVALKGFLAPWDPTGRRTAEQGVLVRHLVLPGEVDNSLAVLRLLHRELGRYLPLSVMSQFQPVPDCRKKQRFTTYLSSADYHPVCDLVHELGFVNVFLQPEFGDERFMPDFNRDTPFEGNRDKA